LLKYKSKSARSCRLDWHFGRLVLFAQIGGVVTDLNAAPRPDFSITDQPLVSPARYRLFINIIRLDVSWDGTASLAADWTIVPRDDRRPELTPLRSPGR
jgi:hypothetical protein